MAGSWGKMFAMFGAGKALGRKSGTWGKEKRRALKKNADARGEKMK